MAVSVDGSGSGSSGPESGAPPLDLTPREVADGAPGRRSRRLRTLRTVGLLALVVGAIGFVLVRGLGDATLFFYNVDEAVAKRGELGERRFRLQGSVEGSEVSRTPSGAEFVLTYNGVEASVRHEGDLPQLFQPGIPVVLEGAWEEDRFSSDRMLVKHSEVYEAENPDRVANYELPAGAGTAAGAATAPAERVRSGRR